MSKQARVDTYTRDVPYKKHKLLDLRNNEHFKKFDCNKFVFKLNSVPNPIDITTHTTTPAPEEEKIHEVVEYVLREGLDYLNDRGIPPYAVIHLYLHCKGLEQDLKFCGAGGDKLTLKQLREEGRITDIVAMFERTIQSGREVELNAKTILTYYAFIPPVEYK